MYTIECVNECFECGWVRIRITVAIVTRQFISQDKLNQLSKDSVIIRAQFRCVHALMQDCQG